MPTSETETFKGLPVLRQTTADKAKLPDILIEEGMEDYSGFSYVDHVKWVRELTELNIPFGSTLVTDESCSEVWLLSKNHYKTTCRLIYLDN